MYESLLDAGLASCSLNLQRMSNDELKILLNDDSKIESLVVGVPQLKSLSTEKDMLLAQNKSLAEWNMSQESKIHEGKQRLMGTYEQAVDLKQQADQLDSELKLARDQKSIDTTLALLQAAAAQAEEESEKLAENFSSGSMGVDQFLAEFKRSRQMAHLRKIKADKLLEIIQASQNTKSSQNAGFVQSKRR